MQRYHCVCGNEVFFESLSCVACNRELGFSTGHMRVIAVEPASDQGLRVAGEADLGERLSNCANRVQAAQCNWLYAGVPEHCDDIPYCQACATTDIIPSLAVDANAARWREMESAKRRLLYSLLRLNLQFDSPGPYGTPALRFAFREDLRTNPMVSEDYVMTGHLDGLITINVAEADASYREQVRESLGQSYRTVLGHLRHESGHFFFDRLLRESPSLMEFREVFGDERIDYTDALDSFYARGDATPAPDFVSAYASAHPLEDWAECWAHMLHIEDTLETATAFGLEEESALAPDCPWLEHWQRVSVVLNELNRSLGQPDAYPFVITPGVSAKLDFTRRMVQQAGRAIGTPAGC